MTINFNVLSPCIENKVCCEIYGWDIVAPHLSKKGYCCTIELVNETSGYPIPLAVTKPDNLSNGISKTFIFWFCARSSNSALLFETSRCTIRPKKIDKANNWKPIIRITYSICIWKSINKWDWSSLKVKTMKNCAFEESNNGQPMCSGRLMHKLSYMIDCKGNSKFSKYEISETSDHTSI